MVGFDSRHQQSWLNSAFGVTISSFGLIEVKVKVEEVSSVLTDHIIKGNELRLLTPPETEDEEEQDLSDELREETAIVRERFKKLSAEDKQLLLETYSIKDDSEEEI